MSAVSDAIEAVKASGKRVRVHDAQMVTKLPKALKDLVNSYAKNSGDSESGVTRLALAEFFEKRGYNR